MTLSSDDGAKRLYDLLYVKQPPEKKEPEKSARPPSPRGQKPFPYRHQIIGIATDAELHERVALKKATSRPRQEKKHAANYKGPRIVKCPCGKSFEIPRHYSADAKKYCGDECRAKYRQGVKYRFTPEQDEEIRKAYAEQVNMRRAVIVRALAEKFGVPRWRVSRHALALGLLAVMRGVENTRFWSEKEKEIVRANTHITLSNIRKKLKKAGFDRSENAIKIFILRNIGQKPKGHYSATSLAKLLGIDSHTIARWIRQRILKARHVGTMRKPQQGGDSWEIGSEDVREFLIKYVALVDFRKLDKFWLVELLTSTNLGN